jgi:DNA-binding NarL/FixJ family response regulator
MGESLEIVLGDDHSLFVEALATVLYQRGHAVCATATTVAGLIEAVTECQPGVCLTDIRYSDGEAVGALAAMSSDSPQTRFIILTADADPETVRGVLAAGAHGFVHKSRGMPVLLDVLDRVAAGEVAVEGARATVRPPASRAQPDLLRLASYLTRRELECLALLAKGLDTTTIARRLGVSRTTVRTHVQSLLSKLGVHSRLEAVSLATKFGLLGSELREPRVSGTGSSAG